MLKLNIQLFVFAVTVGTSCALHLLQSIRTKKTLYARGSVRVKTTLFRNYGKGEEIKWNYDSNGANIPSALSSSTAIQDFDAIVMSRYACTRFHRHEEVPAINTSIPTDLKKKSSPASKSNSKVVDEAIRCLDVARRAPSGFNAQPYKFVVVHSPLRKEQVAKYCLGRNADRVRDSDCTVLFLADRESARDWKRFSSFLQSSTFSAKRRKSADSSDKKTSWSRRKLQLLLLLFSSGWPLPRMIAAPLSFGVRLGVSAVSVITGRRVLVPSLGSSETWSSKNTMLVAMTYLLACTSRGMATCPMEGYNVGGIRKILGIPRRYAIPIIVSTGVAYKGEEKGIDDVGVAHGALSGGGQLSTERYPFDEVVFGDGGFGKNASSLQLSQQ